MQSHFGFVHEYVVDADGQFVGKLCVVTGLGPEDCALLRYRGDCNWTISKAVGPCYEHHMVFEYDGATCIRKKCDDLYYKGVADDAIVDGMKSHVAQLKAFKTHPDSSRLLTFKGVCMLICAGCAHEFSDIVPLNNPKSSATPSRGHTVKEAQDGATEAFGKAMSKADRQMYVKAMMDAGWIIKHSVVKNNMETVEKARVAPWAHAYVCALNGYLQGRKTVDACNPDVIDAFRVYAIMDNAPKRKRQREEKEKEKGGCIRNTTLHRHFAAWLKAPDYAQYENWPSLNMTSDELGARVTPGNLETFERVFDGLVVEFWTGLCGRLGI